MIDPRLLYRTARNLDITQAVAWVRANLRPSGSVSTTGGDYRVDPATWSALKTAVQELGPGDGERRRLTADAVAAGRFRYLNRERCLPRVQWAATYESPLWSYHLRYFDFATDLAWAWRETGDARYVEAYADRWASWLEDAEAASARIEPYPTSVRVINALRSLLLMETGLPPELTRRVLSATRAQLKWLEGSLEVHLQANHYLKNLTALAWGALVFDHEGKDRRGLAPVARLWDEMERQVLRDGGHYERSPMYHAEALASLLEVTALCRVAGVLVPESVPGKLINMANVLRLFTRPDGSMHLFGDSANEERPWPLAVLETAEYVLGWQSNHADGAFALPDTGYHGWIGSSGKDRFIIAAGPPGPKAQPAHAHCDMLSFVLDWDGQPIVVDSGVHGYEGDPYRDYVRSTRAHSTIAIRGKEQHEVWGCFRMARRGSIVEAASDHGDGLFRFQGACRPYHDHAAIHNRDFRHAARSLTVTDSIQGASGAAVSSWLHLHPATSIERTGDHWLARSGKVRYRIEVFGVDESRVRRGERDPRQGWYCPEFGLALAAPVLEMRIARSDAHSFGYTLERV